jgi:hypothetical protein
MPIKVTDVEHELVDQGIVRIKIHGADGHLYEATIGTIVLSVQQTDRVNPLDGCPMFSINPQVVTKIRRLTECPSLIQDVSHKD